MSLPVFEAHPAPLCLDRPVLVVVVDTEEEFDWSKPFDRQATSTFSIPAQDRAHAIYDRYGVIPTYVIDFPVATSVQAVRYLRRLVQEGRAHFGAHCHPWVTPPHLEAVSTFHSYHGNLPREIEAAKILSTTEAVAQAFGTAPHIFKAGRYGVGPNTFQTIQELGYTLDCSYVPGTSFNADGGPDFHGTSDQPFFIDNSRKLLEIPLSVGYSGILSRIGRSSPAVIDNAIARRLHVPGVLSRLGLIERVRLSPEGFDAASQKRLLVSMARQGVRLFTLTYHSPSLVPGNTPYVRTEMELVTFLQTIDSVLDFFRNQMEGQFSTLGEMEKLARVRDSLCFPRNGLHGPP